MLIMKAVALEKRYKISFYCSVVGKLVMIGFSLYSAIYVSSRFFALVGLYALILSIRVPSFIADRYLDRNELDARKRFRKKHWICLFSGVAVLSYLVLSYFINSRPAWALVPEAKPFFYVYFFLVPWAAIRLCLEIARLIRFKKNHDPYYRARTYVNLISVSATVVSTLAEVAYQVQDNIPFVAFVFSLILIALLYWACASFIFIILGIAGLAGKRQNQFALYEREILSEGTAD